MKSWGSNIISLIGLWRDVIIEIYNITNCLTFEILHILSRNVQGCWDCCEKWCLQNRMQIGLLINGEINEKHALVNSVLEYSVPVASKRSLVL